MKWSMAWFYLSWNSKVATIAMHVENTRIHKKTTTAISIAKTYGSKVAPYLDALDISIFQ